jgi:pSer/pThr/pTyr-binding forkhead associated (FHA) protein
VLTQPVLSGRGSLPIAPQTNAKTIPGERNSFIDSKAFSRQHAVVWEEAGKVSARFLHIDQHTLMQILVKDVKSSNGTFINGDRLFAESAESKPCELKSDDIVKFGINAR